MNNRLEKIKNSMRDGSYTCVIDTGSEVLFSTERGVKPLLEFLDSGKDFSGAFAFDKVVGKAAAFIYVKLGVSCLYTEVISEFALKVLLAHSVNVEYGKMVDAIRNRAGNGFCPMESAVLGIYDADEAIAAIKIKLTELLQ